MSCQPARIGRGLYSGRAARGAVASDPWAPRFPSTVGTSGIRRRRPARPARCAAPALFGVLDDAGLTASTPTSRWTSTRMSRCVRAQLGRYRGHTIRSGLVRFERTTERGDRRIVRLAGRGDLIGQEALLQRPYADRAVSCTPVQLCRIPRTLVDELGREGGDLPRELMSRWQRALDAAEAWVAELPPACRAAGC